jgi:hypothetical protein
MMLIGSMFVSNFEVLVVDLGVGWASEDGEKP